MRRKKIFIPPKLRDRKGDVTKKWYVELSMRNTDTQEMFRRRYECYEDININNLSAPEDRYRLAEKIIAELLEKRKTGWTIFNDVTECVYADQLLYSTEAKVFTESVKSTENYTYWMSRYIAEGFPDMHLQDSTRDTYVSRYRMFGLWLKSKKFNEVHIRKITNQVLVDFFSYLIEQQNISKRTYRSYCDLLCAFFSFVRKKAGISENPVYDLPKNKIEKNMAAVRIQPNDLRRLMAALDERDPQLALACRFEYYCGLRPGREIRLMKVGDLDLRKGIAKVRVNWETAKTLRTRYVAISDVFLDYLIEQWGLDKLPATCYVFGKNGKPGTEHLGKNNLRFRFVEFRKQLGLPDENKLYSMKHTGAVVLAEQGETLINIRDHLGHTSIKTTEHYLRRLGLNESKLIRSSFPKI